MCRDVCLPTNLSERSLFPRRRMEEAEEEVGFDRDLFLEKDMNEDYLCSICRNVVEQPAECPHCESLFCTLHVRQWLATSTSCPHCKHLLTAAQLKVGGEGLLDTRQTAHLKNYFTHGL